jgi:hypothetical protein
VGSVIPITATVQLLDGAVFGPSLVDSNFSFALLAKAGHSNWGMAGAIGFENIASGIGGVTVVAYFSALTDLRFTAAVRADLRSGERGRPLLTGTTAGALLERMGCVNFYLTTLAAVPGVVLFWLMMRAGLVDVDGHGRPQWLRGRYRRRFRDAGARGHRTGAPPERLARRPQSGSRRAMPTKRICDTALDAVADVTDGVPPSQLRPAPGVAHRLPPRARRARRA